MNKKVSLGIVTGSSNIFDRSNPERTEVWAYSSFVAIQDNPKQRNTNVRLNKPHLKTPGKTTRSVAVAVLPSGAIYKVNGHSRAAAMEIGQLPKVANFNVTIYSVETLQEVKELYDEFDSRKTVKSAADEIQSEMTEANIVLKTKWLQNGSYSSMLRIAAECWLAANKKPANSLTKAQQIALFKNELLAFDGISPRKLPFNIGIGAAALMSLKKFGDNDETILTYLRRYSAGLGNITSGKLDAVAALSKFKIEEKANGRTGGALVNANHCAIALSLMRRYHGNQNVVIGYCMREDINSFLA